MLNFNTIFGPADAPSRQIQPKQLANEFGEVSIRQVGDKLQVAASVAMGAFVLGDGESCVTGLALDASQSMQASFGRGRILPPEISQKYIQDGKFVEVVRDGVTRKVLSDEAKADAKAKGLIQRTANTAHAPAVEMATNLIRTFSTGGVRRGTCEILYWACGAGGGETEVLGEFSAAALEHVEFKGPRTKTFGAATHLAPPFRHFAEQARRSNGVFVFVTDGRIDDEAEVVTETHRIAEEMNAGSRPSMKCVLIGVGRMVDVAQMDRIDDMEMPAHLESIDIWNSKVSAEMRDVSDAWSEIFDPSTEIGTHIVVRNDHDELVHENADRVNALITFEMPAGSKYFDVVIDGEMEIHQPL